MPPSTKYGWKGRTTFKVSADIAGRRLNRIRRAHGGQLRAEHVVEDARVDESPLHDDFEWNDAKAAEAHRRTRAGDMIRALVVVQVEEPKAEPIRAFVSVRDESEEDERPAYRSMEEALADPVMRRQVLARALSEVESWKRRYEKLEEMAAVFAAIEEVSRKAG